MADSPSTAFHNRYQGLADNISLFTRPTAMTRCQHTDWELCESLRLQELKEARDRAAQMETTMRWWSECTASWREKWATVRDERNRAREEGQALREALESANERNEQISGENRTIETEVQRLRGALHKKHTQNAAANLPEIVVEPLESIDAQVEAVPSRQHKIVQTNETWCADPLTHQHQRNIAHFLEREKCLSLENKVATLESELSDARLKCSEAEQGANLAHEEVDELKRCNEENLRNAKNRQSLEMERLNLELGEMKDENESLRDENVNLHKEIESLRRMLQISLLGTVSPEEQRL
ncbi:unnamed protein product, partial [Mesorhabditis belari]|uniref:Coiled-coil domain-containing protein 102A n=1 Tax=Mesorhabditis belari TaxID=2138241 RepID=A0AAF3EU03_9BILA